MEPFGSGEQLVVVRGGEGVEGGGGGVIRLSHIPWVNVFCSLSYFDHYS